VRKAAGQRERVEVPLVRGEIRRGGEDSVAPGDGE